MTIARLGLGAIAPLVLAAGCADTAPNGPDDFGHNGTGIAVGVSPLTLDTLTDACYSFAVENEAGQLVVGRGPETAPLGVTGSALNTICASQFGNSGGGDISYVAPCDASLGTDDVDGNGQNTHIVTLWVDALCTAGNGIPGGTPGVNGTGGTICQEMQNYVDPCPTGCTLPVDCKENADTPVSFNFTIMGQADQGFFDIAINFDDIFCSAKVDCTNTAGDDIKLLFGRDGERHETLVMAFACTAGVGADTRLYMDNITVTCEDNAAIQFPVKPWVGEGNVHAYSDVAPPNNLILWGPPPSPVTPFPSWYMHSDNAWRPLYQSANYKGVEYLGDNHKVYWNTAMGIYMPGMGSDGDGINHCYLNTALSASNGPLGSNGYPSLANTTHPGITVRVPLNPDGTIDNLECGQNPLDGPDSGVTTSYNLVGLPWCFNFVTSADFDTGEVTSVVNETTNGFPSACVRFGTVHVKTFYDVNADGIYTEGVDLPSGIMRAGASGVPGFHPANANGDIYVGGRASVSMGNSLAQVYFAGYVPGNNPCPSGGTGYAETTPGTVDIYMPQGGSSETVYFGYTCGTPTP